MHEFLLFRLPWRIRRRSLVLLTLLCAALFAARAYSPNAGQDPEDYEAALNSLIAAQQQALASGDPDRIVQSSSPVAAAALVLLDSVDQNDQENRKASGALPYAEALVSDLPSEMLLLKMEVNLGEEAQAAELTSRIVKAHADDVQVHVALSHILEQSSHFEDAVREAQLAVELDPMGRDAQIALGMAFWGLNGFQYNDETLQAFTVAQQADPNGFSSNLLLGSIESQYQRFDAASQHLQAAIAADRSAPDPWYQLGLNAYEAFRPAQASEFLEHYLSLADAGGHGKPAQMRRALLMLDEVAEEQGKSPDGAYRAKEEAMKRQISESIGAADSDTGTGVFPMGSADASEHSSLPRKTGTPKADATTIARLRELAAGALGNIGAALARKQDFADAVAPLKYASEEDPSLEPVTRNLGLAACVSGLYREGEQAFKEIVASHPNDRMPRACLGMAEFEAEEYRDAASTFAPLGPVLSNNPMFEATAAAAFARAGDRERAENALAGLKDAAGDARVEAREALAYLETGHVARAAALAKAALSGNQKAPEEALRVLGLLDLARGDALKAIAEFGDESKADRPDTDNQFETEALLGEALRESGRKSEGNDLSKKLLRVRPNLASMLLTQGKMLLMNGDEYAAFGKAAAAYALAPQDKETRAVFSSAKRALPASR